MITEIAVLDFETTGLSPDYNRIIEVGVVIVKDGQITDRFSQLMDPGEYIPSFITHLTGITNSMIKGQPTPEATMYKLKRFLGDRPIVAHNAAFDKRFLHAEIKRAGLKKMTNPVLCSLLLARRLIPEAADHRLGTLARHLGIETNKRAHRALADVEVTADIWTRLCHLISEAAGIERPSLELIQAISSKPKATAQQHLVKMKQKMALI